MADKLQIDVTTVETGHHLAELAERVTDVPAFIRYLEREALYVIAMAQAEASARREARESSQSGKDNDVIAHYGAPNLQPKE